MSPTAATRGCVLTTLAQWAHYSTTRSALFAARRPGSRIVLTSDSCHSGSVTRGREDDLDAALPRARFLPLEAWMPREELPLAVARPARLTLGLARIGGDLLLAGCQESEYSWDTRFNGRPNGAFTYYALKTLKERRPATYEAWMRVIREYLPSTRLPQTPQILGSGTARRLRCSSRPVASPPDPGRPAAAPSAIVHQREQPTMSHATAKPLRLTTTEVKTGTGLPLPSLLRATTRAGEGELDPLLAEVAVDGVYTLGAPRRGGPPATVERIEPGQPRLLAIETEDGATLFTRSDTLTEAIERIRPEALVDGEVDFARLRDPNAAARGLGDVLWKAATVLRLPEDGVLQEARAKALAWAREQLGDRVEDQAIALGSYLGAKALIWCVEARLAGRPGLYRWRDRTLDPADRCLPGDPRLQAAADGQPMLVLIHGTGSYTLGSFADLRGDKATWERLEQRFPGGIYGYEHRTFSESPIENALALLEALPQGARVSLLTHSRGGLVGDLLCLGQVDNRAIAAYRLDGGAEQDQAALEREAEAERRRLRTLRDRLAAKRITVERYVRVACPARGTQLLSENLDAALSDFLTLLQWGGSALLGVAATALGGPVAGERMGRGASSCLGVLKRLLLEIAGRRIDAHRMPGIAAMRTDSPLVAFLAHPGVHRRDGVEMAVIAGDTEFAGLGLTRLGTRVANLFCDWRLFDRNDNDLVVDTDAMFAGLSLRPGTYYLYDQGAEVDHFHYFHNASTRLALRDWLTQTNVAQIGAFQPVAGSTRIPWRERDARAVLRGAPARPLPVVILIPGIMGTHIEVDRSEPDKPGTGDRIWFDLASLFLGKLERIRDPAAKKVMAEDLFEMFYGDLADHLALTHRVIRCPYDWRRSLDACAQALKQRIETALQQHPRQPIRLLAHSMGGLVARTLIHSHPDTWRRVLESGGRLIMLGTPNNGSHLMVASLLGKSDSLRKLEMIDAAHGLQDILDIVAGFPGALALLPRSNGFVDAGHAAGVLDTAEYYQVARWRDLKARNRDRWYGDGIGAVPAQALLSQAQQAWERLPKAIPNPDRVAYVFGQSDKTPCGVQIGPDGRLRLLYTPDGDGSVTWVSGRVEGLDVDSRCWYMPVEHADLTDVEEYFPAIVDLLEKGSTDALGRLPRRRGEEAVSFVLEAGPPVIPGEEELARAFLGSGPRRRRSARAGQTLRVFVRAGDLRFVDQPVLCGHYVGDAITGAEAALDAKLGGALSQRERMGVYAGDIGSSAIVLQPPNREERRRGSLPGAVIVGLGPFTGQLSPRQVRETVRAAVLRYLLQLRDALGVRPGEAVRLYSLLIGWNSTASLNVADCVMAVTCGVLEANRQFREAAGEQRAIAVTELGFIELYRDAAISAAHAVLESPTTLTSELRRLAARIEPAVTLAEGEGVMERLSIAADLGHWSRLIVTDADALEAAAARPPATARDSGQTAAARAWDASPVAARDYPQRLKYVFLSQRARAETVVQQRQPGLIEAIVASQRHNPAYDARLGHTLFQLMVPLDYKAAAREQARLLLVLDGYTANLPWELLQADDEPMVLRTPMLRQLATVRYRPMVRTANVNSACIIANPSTVGFDRRFPGGRTALDDLPGAVREGEAIAASLRAAGWSDIASTAPGREALDVLNTLYDRPYRILVIAAHGVFEARAHDGHAYTGVVLSDGLLITATEVAQMEAVPEVVFLSCCHLGSINQAVTNPYSEPNRLAYSLARELIEMGVRCVVAAGWAVDDEAACTFASVFFDHLTAGDSFGEVVWEARKATHRRHPGCNTWGAYQAYGDPGYRLKPQREEGDQGRSRPYVAVEELLAALRARRGWNKRFRHDPSPPTLAQTRAWLAQELSSCPPEWTHRADVQQAMAALYADFGSEGFAAAQQAYLQALQLEDEAGRVAVRAIEQLANLEARQGGRLVEQGQVQDGLALIDSAIGRMQALAEAVRAGDAPVRNPERAAILGSALKLKAAALAQQDRTWREVAAALDAAARAYASMLADDAALTPYPALNALQLDWLAGASLWPRDAAVELARRCGEQARKGFEASHSFWDAVMSADATLTVWLLSGGGGPPEAAADPVAWLARCYEDAVSALPQSAREWDSVLKQWRLLARLLRLRAEPGDAARAQVLQALAERIAPASGTPAAAADGSGQTVEAGRRTKAARVRKPRTRKGGAA